MKSFLVSLPLLFVAIFLIYIAKLAPTVYSGDSGDLITAAYFLGIPHPPGYGLYTFLGHLFSLIPANSIAWRLNLMSAFFQAATIPIVFLIIYNLTKKIILAIFGATLLAFSFTFWFYSEITEVFSLNNFFAASLILLAILFVKTKNPIYFYLFSLFLGLSIIHHQTIILIIPALLILIAKPAKVFFNERKRAFTTALFFVLGLVPLIYFPIAAKFNSPILWDNPENFSNFLRLITRADYGTFQSSRVILEPEGGRITHFFNYWQIFLADFTIVGLILTILGILLAYFKNKNLGLFLVAGLAISGPVFLMYANFPQGGAFEISVIERFTLLPAIFAVIAASLGIFYLSETLSKFLANFRLAKKLTILIPLVFLMLPLVLFLENWQKIDLSANFLGKTLAEDILVSLPKDSLVLLRGDTIVFNTQYLHFVENVRPDLKVVSTGVLVTDWYYPAQIRRIYPALSAPEVPASERLSSFINTNFENLQIFQFGPQFTVSGFTLVPFGLGSRLYRDGELPKVEQIFNQNSQLWQSFNIPAKSGFSDVLFDFSQKIYTEQAFKTANFFFEQNSFEKAIVFYKKSLEIDPTYLPARAMLAKASGKLGQCVEAKVEFEKSLKIAPNDFGLYQDLAELYRDCFKNENLAKSFSQMAKETKAKFLDLPPLAEF